MATIAAIREQLTAGVDAATLAALRDDPRAGVQSLLARYDRQQAKLAAQQAMLAEHLRMERSLWPNYPHIAGIDEVGRGPLAGPVVTAAVILPHGFDIPVNDSKQLTAHRREELFAAIISQSLAIGIGVRDNVAIDRDNIYRATEYAMADAVRHLRIVPDYLLVDAMHVPLDLPQSKLIHGDARSASISAASIVAKVIRDRLMTMYDQVYPGYGFAENAGYGTAAHLAGLAEYGVTPIHRRSFSPIKQLVEKGGAN